MRRMLLMLLAALIAGSVAVAPVAAQDSDPLDGDIAPAVREGYTGTGFRNPLLCDPADPCARFVELLYPSLVAADPQTGLYTPGALGGLAADWSQSEDGSMTIQLDPDLTWSDGEPITAFDVFFAFEAIVSRTDSVETAFSDNLRRGAIAAVPLDADTIQFVMEDPACDIPHYLDFPVIPASLFDRDYLVDAFNHFVMSSGDAPLDRAIALQRYESWRETRGDGYRFDFLSSFFTPAVTAGVFGYDLDLDYYSGGWRAIRPSRAQQLAGATPQTDDTITPSGFDYIQYDSEREVVTAFLNGDTDLISNLPLQSWGDVLAVPDVQTGIDATSGYYALVFNFLDDRIPEDPTERLPNPLFVDPDVRQAVQLALNVPDLIDAAVYGFGEPVAANSAPQSWAHNPDLTLIGFAPDEARRLLEDAGWKDITGNGVRTCVTCETATRGSQLQFSMVVDDSDPIARRLYPAISRQLARVGFQVFVEVVPGASFTNVVADTRYDSYLTRFEGGLPARPEVARAFITDDRFNSTAYSNADVDNLLTEAVFGAGCDVEARASLFRQASAILQADYPAAWLFTPYDLVAARPGVTGFDPLPGFPIWNIADWRITRPTS